MNRLLAFTFAAVAMVALTSNAVLAQKKPAQNNNNGNTLTAPPEAYVILARYGEIVGTVENITAKTMMLRVNYDHAVVTGYNRGYRGRPGSPKFQVKHEFMDFELPLSSKLTVTKSAGAIEYDEKGYVKANNGKTQPAKVDDVAAGSKVKATFGSLTTAAAAPKKDSSGAIVDAALPAGRPLVRAIVLLGDSPSVAPTKK